MTGSYDDTMVAGRYRLHRRLARGGMSDVYLAHDEVLNRQVAIKIMYPQYAAEERFVVRFRREATAVAKLNHPNIVAVYDWGPHDDTYYIAMELVEGESLSEILTADGTIGAPDAVAITGAVGAALGYAHQNGIVHRDIKPGNILVADDGAIKVTDFGIARAFEGDADLTATGQVMGTASYFSPEQATGGDVGPRADLYSLGVVLFEMLTGSRPFTGSSPVAIAYKHIHDQPPTPSSVQATVPAGLDTVVARLLAKAPDERYPSAAVLEEDLRRLARGEPLAAEHGFAGAHQRTVGNGVPDDVVTRERTLVMQQPSEAAPGGGAGPYAGGEGDGYYERPNRSGLFVFGLAVATVAVIAAIVVVSGLITGTTDDLAGPVVVPDLIGSSEASASNQLNDLELLVRVQFTESEEAEPGVVIDQQPTAGTEVDVGTVVTIVVVVSEEAEEMPDVVGVDVNAAVDQLTALGFKVAIGRQPSSEVEADHVISQSIAGGQLANRGATVTLTVSTGSPSEAVIPPLAGVAGEQATLQLGQLGFTDVVVQTEPSTAVAQGVVVRVDPASGSTVALDRRITIVVSGGSSTSVSSTSTTASTTTTAAPTTSTTPTTTPTTAATTTTQASSSTTTTAPTSSTTASSTPDPDPEG